MKIITDEIEMEPISNFCQYSDTISNIIVNSSPHFSIGIFGDWGTGKSTLMYNIKNNLENTWKNDSNPFTIWFDASKHDNTNSKIHEDLVKTIAYKMQDDDKYRQISQDLLKSINYVDRELIKKMIGDVILDTSLISLKNNFLEKLSFLSDLERNSIFFNGLKILNDRMNPLLKIGQRVVVFIDELDKCSPSNILEILEFVKLFQTVKGFIFIISFNLQTIHTLSTIDKMNIDGENYLKKIIQLPIYVPKWTDNDVSTFLNLITKNLDRKFADIVSENKKIISLAVENNPRNIKRFINNFIISYDLFASKSNHQSKDLLILIILKITWPKFFQNFLLNNDFRKNILYFLDHGENKRTHHSTNIDNSIELDTIEPRLLNFLKNTKSILMSIEDWHGYSFLLNLEENVLPENKKNTLFELLATGNISKFNQIKETDKNIPTFQGIKLRNHNLRNVNLSGLDLRYSDFRGSDLRESDLSKSDLRGSNLRHVNFDGANLSRANLANSDLSFTSLKHAFCSEANFVGANMYKSTLKNTDLTYSKLDSSSFIDANLESANLEGSDLKNANFSRSNLRKTNLNNTNLSNVSFNKSITINTTTENAISTNGNIENILDVSNDSLHESIIDLLNKNKFSDVEEIIQKTIIKNREKTVEFLLEDSRCKTLISSKEMTHLFDIDPSLIPNNITKFTKYSILAYIHECEEIQDAYEASSRYLSAIAHANKRIDIVTRYDSEGVLSVIRDQIKSHPSIPTRVIIGESPLESFQNQIHDLLSLGVNIRKLIHLQLVVNFAILDDTAFFSIPYGNRAERRFFETKTADAKRAVQQSFEITWQSSNRIENLS